MLIRTVAYMLLCAFVFVRHSWAQGEINSNKPIKPGSERVFDVGNGVKLECRWIPATNGLVTLGSPAPVFLVQEGEYDRKDDEVEHQVELDGFWMTRTEITQTQYVALTGKANPSYFCSDGGGAESVAREYTANFPVENVSWDEAQDCIRLMQVPSDIQRIALPSEAQWEWACRAGKGNRQPYHFGDTSTVNTPIVMGRIRIAINTSLLITRGST